MARDQGGSDEHCAERQVDSNQQTHAAITAQVVKNP
jgi:hypothetical protein